MIPITNISVTPVPEATGRALAYASVTLADCFVINSIRVIRKPDGGIFVAMPQLPTNNPNALRGYKDACHPINKEMRESVNNAILSEFMRKRFHGESTNVG